MTLAAVAVALAVTADLPDVPESRGRLGRAKAQQLRGRSFLYQRFLILQSFEAAVFVVRSHRTEQFSCQIFSQLIPMVELTVGYASGLIALGVLLGVYLHDIPASVVG